jgi:DNA-binding transcriptional MocR family regulator
VRQGGEDVGGFGGVARGVEGGMMATDAKTKLVALDGQGDELRQAIARHMRVRGYSCDARQVRLSDGAAAVVDDAAD